MKVIINIAIVNSVVLNVLFDFAITNMIVCSGKLFHDTTKIPQLIGSMGQIYANIYSCPKIPSLQGTGVRKIELKLKDTH